MWLVLGSSSRRMHNIFKDGSHCRGLWVHVHTYCGVEPSSFSTSKKASLLMYSLWGLPWPKEWEPYLFSRAQLLSLALSLECLENRAWILLHLTNTSCPAQLNSVQLLSPTLQCPTLCDPMDWGTPGFPVHHQLPELAQTHVHWVGDAIQPSHPLPSPSPPALNLSQHQGLFQWVSSSHKVAKVLEFQLQYQSFQWIFRTDFL